MQFTIITLFPEIIAPLLKYSIIKRAIEKEKIKLNIVNLRDFGLGKHKQVDDYQFGGGAGMLLMIEPIINALQKYKTKDTKVVLLSPQGHIWNQVEAYNFAKMKQLKNVILICGHYEGFDERIREYIDFEYSIGDYILTGGELPAMVILESITRLVPGVIKQQSHENDSFNNLLLDHSAYTKPVCFDGKKVPEILLSGHHQKIKDWKIKSQIEKTKNKRPDLWEKYKIINKTK